MPTRKRPVQINKRKRGTQVINYGAGGNNRLFYGTSKTKALQFIRDAAGVLPREPETYGYQRRAELARQKLEYLGHSPTGAKPDKKFQALPASEKSEANRWLKRQQRSRRFGTGRIAIDATYPHPEESRFVTEKLGPHTRALGTVAFRARDFLQIIDEQGGLWEAVAYAFNNELEAQKYPWEAEGKPTELRMVAGEAVEYGTAA
jgi:hypothetical protein